MPIDAPNYTQVPNALFALMPDMGNAELKVVLAVCRQTIGWHKTKDRLTVTRLAELTGLSRQSVYEGISQAIERGILIQEDCEALGHVYSLDIREPQESVKQVDTTVSSKLTESVKKVDTQKKDKETKEKNNKPTFETMSEPQTQAWRELANTLVTFSPDVIEKFCDIWDRFPDVRRHAFAIAQMKKYADAPSFRYYETTFLRYDPDKPPVEKTYPQKREQFTRPSEGAKFSRLPIRTD